MLNYASDVLLKEPAAFLKHIGRQFAAQFTIAPLLINVLLAALLVFRAAGVDLTVLEVGLGGRLDAVNIVDADVAVLCSVGLDHTEWLGRTVEAISREKVGILKPGVPMICPLSVRLQVIEP